MTLFFARLFAVVLSLAFAGYVAWEFQGSDDGVILAWRIAGQFLFVLAARAFLKSVRLHVHGRTGVGGVVQQSSRFDPDAGNVWDAVVSFRPPRGKPQMLRILGASPFDRSKGLAVRYLPSNPDLCELERTCLGSCVLAGPDRVLLHGSPSLGSSRACTAM